MTASTAARPAEALANDVTSGGASLDGEPPALAWLTMSLGLPRGQAPLGPVGFRSKSPPIGAPYPVAYSATGTVADQPLTPSVALLLRGEPDPPPPPPRQKDDDFIEPERLPPPPRPFRLLSLGGEGQSDGVCNRYDSRARPGSPEPRFRVPKVALATRLDG